MTGTAKSSPKRARLSNDDWVSAAFDLLVEDGPAGVKITTLCERFGVTKGSFYWHFADIDGLMEAIADRWCDRQNDTLRGLNQVNTVPVDRRIEVMADLIIDQRNWAVESAVRDWARTDVKVAEAVRELDNRIFEVVQDAFSELGFDADSARVRAGFLVYAGIGFIHGRNNLPTPTSAEMHAIVELLIAR